MGFTSGMDAYGYIKRKERDFLGFLGFFNPSPSTGEGIF